MTTLMDDAQTLAERTADAFSWDNYGERRWLACCRMLLRRGYSMEEAEVILRSKWTRWAGDLASDRGRRYGTVNSADLARFLDTMPEAHRAADVADMVNETRIEKGF